MTMVYSWRNHFPSRGVDVDAAVRVIERVRTQNDGDAPPEAVVQAARSNRSAIHRMFEWDNDEAARLFRLEQARGLVRAIVTYDDEEEEPEPIRVYECVEREYEDGEADMVYVPLHREIAKPEEGDRIIRRALNELRAFRRKYNGYVQLHQLMTRVRGVERWLENRGLPT